MTASEGLGAARALPANLIETLVGLRRRGVGRAGVSLWSRTGSSAARNAAERLKIGNTAPYAALKGP